MRYYEYLKLSTDDKDITKFRSVSFRLVKEETGHIQLLDSIDKDLANKVLELKQELNTELKKKYSGIYKYDLCIDEGTSLESLKIKRKQSKAMSIICHSTNDRLSKIKRIIESKMSADKDI